MTKTLLVTGTSTGSGRELTEQLLGRGDREAAAARRPTVPQGCPMPLWPAA
jgi:NAD(P)-dependent dehydrogenase (short-subunit alcohol dehydrogenase family)